MPPLWQTCWLPCARRFIGSPTAPWPLPPPSFPLLHLPNEVVAKICRMDPDAVPALRLTCKVLHAATLVKKLRLIHSPELPVAAYLKATLSPARLAPLIELDLTRAGRFVSNKSLVAAAGQHSLALQSIALKDVQDLEALSCMRKLNKLTVHGSYLAVGRSVLSPLTNLKALRSLSLTGHLFPDRREGETEAFSLLQPILGLSELTCLELNVSWKSGMDSAMPTAASVQVILLGPPKLTRLALPRTISWDEASLAHLAILTGLTALSIAHDAADGMAPYSAFFQCLAALPRLTDIALCLKSCSSLPVLPALLQRVDAAPCPLRSLELTMVHCVAGARLSDITLHLGAAPLLTHLSVDVSVGAITGCSDDLARLTSFLPALRSLCCCYVKLPEMASSAKLSCMSQLTTLTLLYSNCSVSSALADLSSLQSLTTDLVQQQGLAAICRLTRLTSLVLHGVRGGAEQLQQLSQLKRLRHLEFPYDSRGGLISVDDPAFYAALVHLTALEQCRHHSWGNGMDACSFDDIQRRYIAKRPVG